MTIEVRPVASRRDRRLFRDLPARLHGHEPSFVPMLDAVLAALLDRERNPFWRHADGREWIALRGREAVGRIGACVDSALRQRAPGTGVVGLFESPDDAEVASGLFAEAEAWLAERGCDRGRGPLNYSIHDTAGLLVDGFDTPPTVDTTWNPPYYGTLWERHGWSGRVDTVGAAGPVQGPGWERAQRFARRAGRRGATVRPVDLSRFGDEVEAVRKVYNAAWDPNWGHVPIGAEEFAFKAGDLKPVLDPDLVLVAECDARPVGFLFSLPDLNVPIRRSRGRLLPLGWLRLLRARRTVSRIRVLALGVIPGYQKRGIEAQLLSEAFARAGHRYSWVEVSWILEENTVLLNNLGLYGLETCKRWRIYEKELTAGLT